MKFNLGNFPKWRNAYVHSAIYQNRVRKWRNGLEAELREDERYIRNMPEANLQHLRDKVRAYEKKFKEILGDEV